MGILASTSAEVRAWIQDRPSVNEESITDWMLRNISKGTSNIQYHIFNHTEESEEGADWIWCFQTNTRYFLLLVQAKKLKKAAYDNHKTFNYHNRNGRQIELLLKHANEKKMLATYAFYCDSTFQTACGVPLENEGVFIASAKRIKQLDDEHSAAKPTTGIEEVLKKSIGLSCFERCLMIWPKPIIASNFENFLKHYLVENEVDPEQRSNCKFSYSVGETQLPEYLQWIVRHNGNIIRKTDLPDWFEEKFREQIRGVLGVVLVDLDHFDMEQTE